jgi:sulfate adenylyltransferase
MRLADGNFWPIPVCLDIDEKLAQSLERGSALAVRDPEGFLLAVLTVEDVWKPDKRREAIAVYGTDSREKHPALGPLYDSVGSWYVGGRIEGISLPVHHDFRELRYTPSQTRHLFMAHGWRNVVAFHTDVLLHCADRQMILTAAKEAGAHVFLQPATRISDSGYAAHYADHYTKVRCYREVVKRFPKNLVLLGLIPLATRGAGPREALWHAMIRKNYGCSHFMVAVDHADPFAGKGESELFYNRYAAQELMVQYEEEIGIKAVPLKKVAYVEEKAQYVPESQLGPGMTVKEISAAELMRRLENDLDVPEWFTYPEVLAELRQAYPPRSRQGFTIFFSGLSGSGKSTLAKVLVTKFMEQRERPVTLLDGDIVRKNLSSELGFSKEHRNLNITRIGFVASEITKNGGIAICAPIAPYEESRQHNRQVIGRYGGYIEVYVSTPLAICEQRDRKGMYAKARAGLVKGFTGIDDPYEPPSNPELTIDTSDVTPEGAAQEILLFLAEQGYIR